MNYKDMIISELEKILKDIMNQAEYKSKKNNMLFDPLYGRPEAQKQFDKALKRAYPHWFNEKENNEKL